MNEGWIQETKSGTPKLVQAWTFNARYFVAGNERLNLDLRQVRQIEEQELATFRHSTTLN